MRKQIIIGLVILLATFGLYKWGYRNGYNQAKLDMQTKINLDKSTLDNHAKTLKIIHSESDTNVVRRLRRNLGTD